jgi:hypothetical protein
VRPLLTGVQQGCQQGCQHGGEGGGGGVGHLEVCGLGCTCGVVSCCVLQPLVCVVCLGALPWPMACLHDPKHVLT